MDRDKKSIEILKSTKNDESESREVIEVKAITDSTGNTTTSEEVTVPITFINDTSYEVEESYRTFVMQDNIQGIIIYDKTFSGFRLEKEKYLIQLENNGTIQYGWDGPETKGITVE